MTKANQTGGEVSPRQPLGSPVGGTAQTPASPPGAPSPALLRILTRIDDADLREILLTPKGGQFARAVAAEFDAVAVAMGAMTAAAGPATLVSDMEAHALIRFLDDHFSVAGHVPRADERLVSRVMLTLKGLADQLITLQRSVSRAPGGGTQSI